MKDYFPLTEKSEKDFNQLCIAMASRDKATAYAASESFAVSISALVAQVLPQLYTSEQLFDVRRFDPNNPPRIEIDEYRQLKPGDLKSWSPSVAGGTQYNEFVGTNYMYFDMIPYQTAIAISKANLNNVGIDQLRPLLNRAMDELYLQDDQLGWAVLLSVLATARNGGSAQVIESNAKDAGSPNRNFTIDDLNRLITRTARLRQGWAGGTAATRIGSGITNIYGSPEFFEKLRGISYNPVNVIGSTVGTIPATDPQRAQLWSATGRFEFSGIVFTQLNELGAGGYLNNVFSKLYNPQGGDPSFNPQTEDLIVAVDQSVPAFVKAVSGSTGNRVTMEVDDQHNSRSKKVGWVLDMETGYLTQDDKTVVGMIW